MKSPAAILLFPFAIACSRNVEPFVEPPPAAFDRSRMERPGWMVSGVVDVAPDLRDAAAEGGVLFVTARVPGERMPLAVERYDRPSFPLPFELQAGHGGAPGSAAAALEVGARLSRDGAVGPARPGDLEGTAAGPVGPGDTGVQVVLGVVR